MWEVVFDLETKQFFDDTKTSDPADLGVSILSLYHRQVNNDGQEIAGQLLSFWEKDFENMWKIFQEADRIIGFNSLSFDVPALRPYAPANFSKLPHFDILEIIKGIQGRRTSLNSISRETLGNTKTDHGSNAIKYWQDGSPESLSKLKSYCEADVIITRDIYDFGKKNKYLKYIDHWNNSRIIEVDFSYKHQGPNLPGIQSSLF